MYLLYTLLKEIAMPIDTISPVKFLPSNDMHRRAYLTFLNTGKWNIRFELEFPFTSVPSMVMYKLAEFACKAEGAINKDRAYSDARFVNSESINLVPTRRQFLKAV
jgi:hypothetical protein